MKVSPANGLLQSEAERFGYTQVSLFVSLEVLDSQRACARHSQESGLTKIWKCACPSIS